MELSVTKRAETKKSVTKELRREGKIPAILYSPKKSGETILVDGTEFATILREMKPGRLPTMIFNLKIGSEKRRAIIKDIQYHLTSNKVIHLDFEELLDDTPVIVKVPLYCIGVADCPGIKLGGFLRQVHRYIKVKALPKKLPQEFVVDVKELQMGQSKRVSDLAIPDGVRSLSSEEEVVVLIAKR